MLKNLMLSNLIYFKHIDMVHLVSFHENNS